MAYYVLTPTDGQEGGSIVGPADDGLEPWILAKLERTTIGTWSVKAIAEEDLLEVSRAVIADREIDPAFLVNYGATSLTEFTNALVERSDLTPEQLAEIDADDPDLFKSTLDPNLTAPDHLPEN